MNDKVMRDCCWETIYISSQEKRMLKETEDKSRATMFYKIF